MFKKISGAYSVLSDQKKRDEYDAKLKYGDDVPFTGFSGFDMGNAHDLFENFFANDPFMDDFFGRKKKKGSGKNNFGFGGFDDDFGGFGFSGFSGFSDFGDFGGFGGGVGKSVSQTTQIMLIVK